MCQYTQAIAQCASRNIDPQRLANEQRAQAARHHVQYDNYCYAGEHSND